MFSVRKISLAVALAAAPFLATAQDYQFEVKASYANIEEESTDSDVTTLAGTFYWNQVSTAGHPLAEAAFLERQGGLTVGYLNVEDFDTWSLEADHYFDSGLYLAGRYNMPEEGDNTFGASIGFSPAAGLLFVLDADDDSEDINYAGRVKYVGELQGDAAFGLEAGVAEDTVSISGDYFFNRQFSVGAEIVNDSDIDYTLLGVEAKYFIAPNFWAGAGVGTNVSGDADTTVWQIEAGLRF